MRGLSRLPLHRRLQAGLGGVAGPGVSEWAVGAFREDLYINVLELRAIRLSLRHFTQLFRGGTVAVFSDNTTALAYLYKEGGTRSSSLNSEAPSILRWAEEPTIRIVTHFITGSANVLVDCLSRRHQLISTEWMLHQDVCRLLWKVWGSPTVDLFATSLHYRFPHFISPFPDHSAVATDAFLSNWDDQELYVFPPSR